MMNYRFKYLVLVTCSILLSAAIPSFILGQSNHCSQAWAQTSTTDKQKTQTDKLFQQGVQQFRCGEYPQALQTYQRVLEIRRQQGDRAEIAQTLNNMGELYYWMSEGNKALEVLREALAIRRDLKDKAGEGETLDNIGLAYFRLQQDDKALETLQQALAIRKQIKDKAGEGKTLSNIGTIYSILEKYPQALENLQQALAIHEEVGDKFHKGITLQRLGLFYQNKKDYPRALELYNKAVNVSREVDNSVIQGYSFSRIGLIYSVQKKYDSALKFYQQALPIFKRSGIRVMESNILAAIGRTYIIQDKYQQAITFYQQALPILQQQPALEAEALNFLGSAYLSLRDYQKAEGVLLKAMSIAKKIEDLDAELSALKFLNMIYVLRKNHKKEIESHLRKLEIARKQNDKLQEVNVLGSLAIAYNNIGKHEKALEIYQQSLAVLREIEINKLPLSQEKWAATSKFLVSQGLSFVYRDLGEYDKALLFAQQTLKKAESLNQPQLEVQALLNLANLYNNSFDNPSKAIEFSQKALNIARQALQPKKEAEALINLSKLYSKQPNYTLALEYAQKGLKTVKKLNNPQLEYSALGALRDIYHQQGQYEKALEFAQKVYTLVQKENLGIHQINTLASLSQSYLLVGDTVKAEETAKEAITLAKRINSSFEKVLGFLSLAQAYKFQGKYEQGIEAVKQALAISKETSNFQVKVTASALLSEIYEALGDHQKVIALAQPNLKLARKIGRPDKEAQLLINLGNAYRVLAEYTTAKELIEQGLKIGRKLKSPRLELIALNNLGYYYASLNDYQKALELTQQSLKIAQKLKDSPDLLIYPQFSLGDIYSSLGDYQKSHDFYQQVLKTSQKLKNRRAEGIALLSLAGNDFNQGKPQKTLELSQQALTIFQEIKVPQLEAFAYRMLSAGYGELGNDANAIKSAQSFLAFARKVQNPVFEKNALSFLGMLHYRFGRNQEAIKAYQQALAIQTPENVTGDHFGIHAGLGRVYRKLNQTNISIGYYKQAINSVENFRREIEGLPPELQNSFLDKVVDFKGTKTADIYRELAELLISQGRQAEARQVLDLLKIQEIRDFAEGQTDAAEKPQVKLTETEKKIQTGSQSIIALSRQISECEKTNCKEKSKFNDKFTALLNEFNQDLEEIDKQIRDHVAKDPNTFIPDSRTAVDIVRAQPGTVMIYPLVLEDKLWLLLYSGKLAKKFEVKQVSQDELGNTVKEFRRLMEECEKRSDCGAVDIAKIQPVSQKLYNWLIKPLEGELKQNKIKNLVFALDRVTRYIPMSALYDGKQYLIENYTVYNVLSAELTDASARLPIGTQNTPILAMGVSDALDGFSKLENVPKEVDTIVRSSSKDKGIYPGKEYLNKSFDYKTLRDNLTGNKILHLATHGKFVPDREDASYLLLGNGKKLTIPKIKTLASLSNIHLVVLSACQTALGGPRQDGVEIASLAYSFINRGAKSVMASLWQVADQSTSELMQNFYQNLAYSKKPITKAEAMRLAQLKLLYGKEFKLDDIKRAGGIIPSEDSKNSSQNATTKITYSHPYYWAPFVLIGNGL